MAYIAYVDLSAKAEQWKLDSAIAVSNGVSWVYLVPSDVKIQLRDWLSTKHGSKNLKYRTLAVLIYLAIRERIGEIDHIVIDKDYTGAEVETTIKNLLLPLLRRNDKSIRAGFINFENVKGSRADRLAKQVFDGKRAADREITWSEVEKILTQ